MANVQDSPSVATPRTNPRLARIRYSAPATPGSAWANRFSNMTVLLTLALGFPADVITDWCTGIRSLRTSSIEINWSATNGFFIFWSEVLEPRSKISSCRPLKNFVVLWPPSSSISEQHIGPRARLSWVFLQAVCFSERGPIQSPPPLICCFFP